MDAALRKREEEEAGNAMKALENRTQDSKREIDIVNALDEVRALNNRHAAVGRDDAIAALRRQEVEDAALFEAQVQEAARTVFRHASGAGAGAGGAGFVRRLDDDDEEEDAGAGGGKRQRVGAEAGAAAAAAVKAPPPRPAAPPWPRLVVKRKDAPAAAAPAAAAAAPAEPATGLAGLLGAYGSSSGEDSG